MKPEEQLVNIRMEKRSDRAVVTVEGRLDTLTAPELESKVLELIHEGQHRVILDLSQLEYISSAGLRTILVAAKQAQANGGDICCCGLNGVVKRVFDVTGFSSMIPVFDSVDSALARG